MVSREGCSDCIKISEALMRGKPKSEGALSVLRWITNYREQYEFIEPCINKICLPLLMVAGGQVEGKDNGVPNKQ